LACIVGGGFPRHQSPLAEAAQHAAEIARIQPEIAHQIAGGHAIAIGQFVKHAGFGQREGRIEPAVFQHADLLGVEAVEAAHGQHLPLQVFRQGFRFA
jgi:hypothetical protein